MLPRLPKPVVPCQAKTWRPSRHIKKVKVKDTALDLTVLTGGADLRFLALQPGSAMGVGGQPSCAFAHPSCLPSPDFSRYPIRAGSTLAKLTGSHH